MTANAVCGDRGLRWSGVVDFYRGIVGVGVAVEISRMTEGAVA